MPSHEFEFIDWLRRRLPGSPQVPVGIGDDTAALALTPGRPCLVTHDVLLEGVHFDLAGASPEQVGRKALAVNLSDIAAMAGRPIAAVVGLALPRRGGMELGKRLAAGMQPLAERYGLVIAGGDTNSWHGPLVIGVTVVGEATERGPILRSGAKPGDWLIATGSFGASLAGKHLNFEPRIDEALTLAARYELHAMIDVSDGLAADAAHVAHESRAGIVLVAEAIPISPEAAQLDAQAEAASRAVPARATPLDRALSDGEDFELLIAVPESDARAMLAQQPLDVPLHHVGRVITEPGLWLERAGVREPLEPRGFVHGFDD